MRVLLLAAFACLISVEAGAQKYPDRPITFIAPFTAGTTADVGGRVIAEHMGKRLGQRIVIENIPGALGEIAVKNLLARKADGYTLCYCNDGSVVTVPASYASIGQAPPYTPDNFTAVGQSIGMLFLLAVHTSVPAKNLKELLAYSRAQPKGIAIGAPSPMSIMITGMLARVAGADAIIETRYGRTGEPGAIQDLLSGSIQAMVASTNTIQPHALAGTIRIIGAVGTRNPYLPDIPTLREQKDAETEGFVELTEQLMPWNGLLGPKGLPPDVVRTLSETLKDTLEDPAVIHELRNLRMVVRYSDPPQFQALALERFGAVTKLLRDSNIRLR